MGDWLRSLIGAASGGLRRLAEDVYNKLVGLWNQTTNVWARIRGGWLRLYAMAAYFLVWAGQSALEAALTLQWVITILIPNFVGARLAELRAWAAGIVNAVEARAKAALNDLLRWTLGQVNNALSILDSVRRWALDRVAEIRAVLNRITGPVVDLLTDPARLAEWVVGALWSPLWRLLYNRREAIAEWFTARSVSATRWLARELESIIVRLF